MQVILVSSICPATISPLQWRPHSDTSKTSYLIQNKIYNFFSGIQVFLVSLTSLYPLAPFLPHQHLAISHTPQNVPVSEPLHLFPLPGRHTPLPTRLSPSLHVPSLPPGLILKFPTVLLNTYTGQESNTALHFEILQLAAESRSLKVCTITPQLLTHLSITMCMWTSI